MQLQEKTFQQQCDLAEFCRTDSLPENLEVNPKRVKHYRRLVFTVINDNLQAAYPLTYNFLAKDTWKALVERFFANYKTQSSQIWKMPLEFYHYFLTEESALQEAHPFLNDLLNFEWSEIEVFMMEDKNIAEFKESSSIYQRPLVLNPEYKLISLKYPVHLYPTKKAEINIKGEYYLFIYRERDTGKVKFIDIPAIFALLIENLYLGVAPEDITDALINQLLPENPNDFKSKIKEFILHLRQRNVICGTAVI